MRAMKADEPAAKSARQLAIFPGACSGNAPLEGDEEVDGEVEVEVLADGAWEGEVISVGVPLKLDDKLDIGVPETLLVAVSN